MGSLNTFDKWKLITSILQEIPTLFSSPIVVKIQFYLKEFNPPTPWPKACLSFEEMSSEQKSHVWGRGIEA